MELHNELLKLRQSEKQIGSQIIAKLQLMEEGRKYLSLGYSSLFDYLVRGLGYSESAAYQKQSCVRLTKEIPEVKEKIDSGALTASGLSMAFKTLKSKSTSEKRQLLQRIENLPTREIKKILVQEESAPPIKIEKTEYNDRVIVRLELTKEQNQKLERLKALNSHKGDLAKILEGLIDKALKEHKNKVFKKSRSKNPRFVSKTLRNHLLKNANERCEFSGCVSTHYLQIDHILPIRNGGQSKPENLQVLCGVHNRAKG